VGVDGQLPASHHRRAPAPPSDDRVLPSGRLPPRGLNSTSEWAPSAVATAPQGVEPGAVLRSDVLAGGRRSASAS
jgi:hypothetical protein